MATHLTDSRGASLWDCRFDLQIVDSDAPYYLAISTLLKEKSSRETRGRLQHRTKHRRLRRSLSHAKTDAPDGIARRIPDTLGSAAIDRKAAVPGTATQHSVIICSSFPRTSVSRCTIIIVMPFIAAPFPNIPVHIVQTKRIGRKTSDIRCLFAITSLRRRTIGIVAIIIN